MPDSDVGPVIEEPDETDLTLDEVRSMWDEGEPVTVITGPTLHNSTIAPSVPGIRVEPDSSVGTFDHTQASRGIDVRSVAV